MNCSCMLESIVLTPDLEVYCRLFDMSDCRIYFKAVFYKINFGTDQTSPNIDR